jgi:hypothetical protein
MHWLTGGMRSTHSQPPGAAPFRAGGVFETVGMSLRRFDAAVGSRVFLIDSTLDDGGDFSRREAAQVLAGVGEKNSC